MTTWTVVDPLTDDQWKGLVTSVRSDVFHSPRWLNVLKRTYGFQPAAFITGTTEAVPTAGVPFIDVHDAIGPRRMALPFSDSCDMLGDDRAFGELSDALLNFDGRVRIRTLHDQSLASDPRFDGSSAAAWHAISVGDSSEMWSSISSSARRAVRRAQQAGITTKSTTEDRHLRSFYELHLATRKHKYALLPQPYAFFKNIADEFFPSGAGFIQGAFDGDELVAGILFLEWQDRWYYKFNASHPEYLGQRPNDACMWGAIEDAAASNITSIDLGLSDLDQPGLLRYKSKYATEEAEIITRTATKETSAEGARFQETLSALTVALTDPEVPDRVTEVAGAQLYRYFA